MCTFIHERIQREDRKCELRLPPLQMFKHEGKWYCQHHIKWIRTDVSKPREPKTIIVNQDESESMRTVP